MKKFHRMNDVRLMDVSYVDNPLDEFQKIRLQCCECGKFYAHGKHPDNDCRMGAVDNVMRT